MIDDEPVKKRHLILFGAIFVAAAVAAYAATGGDVGSQWYLLPIGVSGGIFGFHLIIHRKRWAEEGNISLRGYPSAWAAMGVFFIVWALGMISLALESLIWSGS